MDAILDSCWSRLSERARTHGIELVRETGADLPEVYVDLERARRALTNLVVNAIKTAPPDSRVVVGAHLDGPEAVRLDVIDHGSALTPNQLARVGECFRPDTVSHTKETKGFGLGLSVVGQLACINLGSASVRSEEGVGNTHSFTMPIARTDVVVRRYLTWISSMDETSTLCALRVCEVTPTEPDDGIRAFLASVSRATDLELPAIDGDGFVICGVGYKPDEWRARVSGLYAESALRVGRLDRSPLVIDILGTRNIRDSESFLLEHLACELEARPHAEVHSDCR
ncbi:MAG: ATP-binding protein [Phycisphaera sp.]|nr:MAG: ATP-binding protein [Phycisphaera sp.]